MKIGIYTDVHCSYTSSILPLHCEGTKYTTRLQMILDTFKWFYNLFEREKVDIIVNCGDLFDSHNLRSEEISAMSEALKFSNGTPEYHILGNHEILDKNRNFYATAMLDNYPYITVVDTPLKLDNGVSFLPYMETESVNEVLPYISNKILFSHIDIQGSRLNSFHIMDTGANILKLKDLFNVVINGHIHSYQNLGHNIYNIGATTSYSFADDMDTLPGVAILNTDNMKIDRYPNPHAIRFIKLSVNDDMDYLKTLLSSYNNYNIALRIECSFEDKGEVNNTLEKFDNIIVSRVQCKSPTSQFKKSEDKLDVDISDNVDVKNKFLSFLKTEAELKYPLENYIHIIKDLEAV